ncbi:hypothetical protein OIU84_019874 [Salix udensis]|uniref:DUF674 family protein n=1 Tax=Salix udensis TaxID=889485 RepID=A0AAD6PJK4_9ROSI|nr:hypothetical protein OIU84_019874 [Salix udensis]
MPVSKMSLKLLIDSKHSKVIFGEAGKDFVDFLLNLLALPLGNVIQLLTKSTMTGCVANLYESLEKLDESYLQPNQNKDSILKPIITTEATNPNFLLPNTKKPEKPEVILLPKPSRMRNDSTSTDTPTTDQGGYVKGLVTYMVTNDLSVSPMSMVSGVSLLNKFNIKDFGVLEEKVVQFGINECLELLKASLLSKGCSHCCFPS